MALDPNVQPYISTFIRSQFPRLYEEYGQVFMDFVEAYYEWMETEGPLYDSRRASSYQDIDTTVDKYLIYFKDKYLPNIQLETVSNIPQLVKHSLDVYRSRGTIRSIDLLFRLVFGIGAEVYYPFDDVFQPSSGEWIIPRYLEVSQQDDLNKFVGKEIIGITSGATAFVESWVRKRSGSKQIDCLYISALEGNFSTGERINAINNPFNLLTCPTMIGSLSEVTITGGGIGFNVGDIVPIQGTNGYGAQGRVANTSQSTGIVNFTLNSGGYGYTANSQVLVSQYVLSMVNTVPGANVLNKSYTGNTFFEVFEQLQQPMATINYQAANNGHFANNDTISAYATNGAVLGTGTVIAQTIGVSTNGSITVAVLSGNLQANVLYNQSNTIFASVPVSNGYLNITATGNVIAESLSFTANVTAISGTFQQGEIIQQGNNLATLTSLTASGSGAKIVANNRIGVWQSNTTFIGVTSGASATLQPIAMNVGVINATGTFIGDSRAPIIGVTSGTGGIIPVLNQGSGATFSISPTLAYPENVNLNTDYLRTYANVALNANAYNLPANTSANVSSALQAALTQVVYTIGSIGGLVGTNPGVNYTTPPFARIYEPVSFAQQKLDALVLSIGSATANFTIGELVTEAVTNARGFVTFANSSTVVIRNFSVFNIWTVGSNFTGGSTGAVAQVTALTPYSYTNPENIAEVFLGFDADITATSLQGDGSLTEIDVLDSGWGFLNGDSLVIPNGSGNFNASGEAQLVTQGQGQGFYRTENGFVSDIKKIQDSDYYQVSSYEVRASVAFEHYVDMLKALLHVAGTKPFGAFIYRQTANAQVNILPATITQH